MSATSLAHHGTPRLFYGLLQQRFTGLVHLRDLPGSNDARIYVHEGVPWFTDLANSASLLGELLVNARSITQADLHQALMAMAQSGQLLGHILVAQGKLNAQQLGQVLAFQCQHKLVHLFSFTSGQATLEAQEKLQGLKAGLTQGVNSLQLIMQGVRTHWDQARMAQVWGQSRGQTLQSNAAFEQYRQHFALNAAEQAAATALAKGWTLGSTGSSLAEEQLAFALWNCGMVQSIAAPQAAPVKTRPARPSAPPAAPRNTTEANPRPLPTARSTRPKTKAPIRPRGARKTNSRFNRLPTGMVPEQAANQRSATPSSPSKTRAKDPKAREIFMANLETYEALIAREVHAFALFDLPLTATRSDVRKQWNVLSRDFHPDALPKLDLESMHTRTQRVFAHLSNAYQVLSNKERRAALRAQLESGIDPNQDAAEVVRQSLESESLIKDAERLLKKSQYQRAKELLEKANALRKDQAEVLAGLAWCDYHLAQRSPSAGRQAMQVLRKVAQEHEKCANASYYLGMIHIANQDPSAARRAFNQAVTVNPRFLEAQRQLRALANAAPPTQAKPKKKKLFGR